MKPALQKFKADAAGAKAYAAWAAADAAWNKACAAWEGKNHDLIIAHTKECPGCKWDGEKLPQMDWI